MNATDRYAITVMNEETIIGHLPKKFFKHVWCSYEKVPYPGSFVRCTVTESRCYSSQAFPL